MSVLLVFAWIWGAMIATSFWEAYVEGDQSWDKGKLGWKIRYKKYTILTAYHFFLFWVMFPLLLTLPFVMFGFDLRLLGMVITAYVSGLVLQDFFWFVVNPTFKMKTWSSTTVDWYPWIKLGGIEFPLSYLLGILVALLSWMLLWR